MPKKQRARSAAAAGGDVWAGSSITPSTWMTNAWKTDQDGPISPRTTRTIQRNTGKAVRSLAGVADSLVNGAWEDAIAGHNPTREHKIAACTCETDGRV